MSTTTMEDPNANTIWEYNGKKKKEKQTNKITKVPRSFPLFAQQNNTTSPFDSNNDEGGRTKVDVTRVNVCVVP